MKNILILRKTKKRFWQLSICFLILFFTINAFADQCTNAFPNGANGIGNNSNLNITCGAKINGAGTSLPFVSVNSGSGCSGAQTCNTASCTATGASTSTFTPGTFQQSSGAGGNVTVNSGTTTIGNNNTITDYSNITVNSGATLNFSAASSGTTTYRMNTLSIAHGSTLNLPPGDYWINNFTSPGGTGVQTINVQGSGTVRLWFNNTVNPGATVNWNSSGSASQLLIYGYQNITFNSGSSVVNAILYAQGTATIEDTTAFTGAVTANQIVVHDTAVVTFDSTAVNNTNFGSTCPFSAASQFGVSAPSTGTNCQNMTVTVTAENSSGSTITNYTGAITLTTQNSTGTWVSTTGGGSFSGGSSGTATYQFVAGDHGVVSFQLSYPASGVSPMTVEAFQTNNNAIKGFSGPITFNPASLLVTDSAGSTSPFTDPETAATNFTMYLIASTSSCGTITSYTGAKTIRFYTSFVNPTSGTLNATINGTAIANSAGATHTTQTITFTNGVASVTAQYPDVGQLMLSVSDTATNGPSGQSGNFVVKPANFVINVPNYTVGSTCLAQAPPSAVIKAGNNFTVNVQPRNSLGNVTPNYGNETSPQGILLQSSSLTAPAGGRNGSNNTGVIGNGSTFTKVLSGGSNPFSTYPFFTGSTFSFDEVGCINLIASVGTGSYLGAGNVTSSTPIVTGRFIPDHFSAGGNTPIFTTGNISAGSSFTYLDQPFFYGTNPILTVTAQSSGGTTTQNYTGSFLKLTSSGFNPSYTSLYTPVNTGDVIPSLILSYTIPTPTFVDGGLGAPTYTFSAGSGLTIQRSATTPSPAFTADLQLKIATITDSDGVACTGVGCTSGGFAFGAPTLGNGIGFSGTGTGNGKQFFHGRIAMNDVAGSQLMPLSLPLQVQYYTSAGGFVINTLDSNSVITAASVLLTASSSPAGFATTSSLVPSSGQFQSGNNLNIQLSAPTATGGANPTGYFDVELNLSASGSNLPWLQYAWPYGSPGTFSDPRARCSFGVYQGNNRLIYESEIFQ